MFFFFNDTATTEIYTLSLHDALPISRRTVPCHSHSIPSSLVAYAVVIRSSSSGTSSGWQQTHARQLPSTRWTRGRSEEHTSELQSRQYLVCRLLLEKKKEPIYIASPI